VVGLLLHFLMVNLDFSGVCPIGTGTVNVVNVDGAVPVCIKKLFYEWVVNFLLKYLTVVCIPIVPNGTQMSYPVNKVEKYQKL
jgi:hypothetical protein